MHNFKCIYNWHRSGILYFDIPSGLLQTVTQSFTQRSHVYIMVNNLWIKDLLLCFHKIGFFQFLKWYVLFNMEQSKLSCFHVILCEMNYELDILHYALINHSKILTRKPIQMQITVR